MPAVRHVALNALFLDPSASGGPESYLRGLVGGLGEARPELRLTVFTTRRGARRLAEDGWPARGIGVRALACDEGQRVRRQVAEQLRLASAARAVGADVLHSLASVAPIRPGGIPHVITLHDVNFIHHQTFGRVTTWGMRQVIPRAARHADELIAVTAVARDDIAATLGLDPAAFTVVHHGAVRPEPVAPVAGPAVRAALGIPAAARVVLCLGAKRPHKNQELLLRAVPLLPRDVVVVLVGHPEAYDADLRALADALHVRERVVFADFIPDAELEGLWSDAAVAAFPTLAEGFGMPVLEALGRGVPVACSDLAVLREVGGEAPRFFDPRSAASAALAIGELLDAPPDPDVGRRWAARFTWAATGAATASVYDRAVAAHST